MPNLLTHAYVAAEALPSSDPDVLLGSTLPDLVGMYRDYTGSKLRVSDIGGRALREGIAVHIATDDVFDHYNPLKTMLVSAAMADFEAHETTVPRGVQRLCSDPGTEILLDGIIQQDRDVTEMFIKLADDVANDRTSLASATPDQNFSDFVKSYYAQGQNRLSVYENPAFVAELLQMRSAARATRRGKPVVFGTEYLPITEEVFTAQVERLKQCSGIMMDQVIHTLKSKRIADTHDLTIPDIENVSAAVGHVSGHEAEALLRPDADADLKSRKPPSIHARVLLRQLFGIKKHGYIGRSSEVGLPMPPGLVGSISHARSGWVAAVLAQTKNFQGVGVDIDLREGQKDISRRVCLPSELGLNIPSLPRVVAGAKEAIYKAITPTVNNGKGRYVGFQEVGLNLVETNGNVMVFSGIPHSDRLKHELLGMDLQVIAKVAGGHVLSLATLKPAA